MGDDQDVVAFVAEDAFLRRTDRKRYVDADGTVSADTFKPRDNERGLSFTYRSQLLQTDDGLDEYRRKKRLPSGDLPGICQLTYYDLTESLRPPRPPRYQEDPNDPDYGKLHYLTDLPENEAHMEQMAKLATRHGLLRTFERGFKRSPT